MPRKEDEYDTPILYWQEANLRLASTARVSKVFLLPPESFIFKIGDLHSEDLMRIEEMNCPLTGIEEVKETQFYSYKHMVRGAHTYMRRLGYTADYAIPGEDLSKYLPKEVIEIISKK